MITEKNYRNAVNGAGLLLRCGHPTFIWQISFYMEKRVLWYGPG